MSGIFRWAMRHGAKMLFVVAVIQLVIGLIPLIASLFSQTGRMASNLGYSPEYNGLPFGMELTLLFNAVVGAAFPLFGALVIDRLDRWLAIRAGEAGQ